MRKKVFIIAKQHFDLIWRRCFDRDFEYDGMNFISYADLQEYYIKDNIEFCKKYPFYNFEIECVAVLDKFLERNPDYKDIISEYIKQGKIYIPFSGINIVDSNMVYGESIIRNFLCGYYYLKNNYGVIADGMDRNDAFGNSAQLPQIARGFGTKWIYHITYSECTKPYWKGLDGSVVYNMTPKTAGSIGGYRKYRPCPACLGHKDKHCDVCGNRRIDEKLMEKMRFRLELDTDSIKNEKIPGYIYAGGEEILPMEDIIKWSIDNRDKYDIEFINFKKYKEYYREYLEKVDEPAQNDIYEKAECNCNNTGCYVTRIKIKQGVRKLENSIYSAENLAVLNLLKHGNYPYGEFEKLWNKLLFTMFHDALPATIVDPAYEEIMQTLSEGQRGADGLINNITEGLQSGKNGEYITVYNPNGIKLSSRCSVRLKKGYAPKNAEIISVSPDGEEQKVVFAVNDIEPFGTKEYSIEKYNDSVNVLFELDDEASVGEGILTNKSNAQKAETDSLENIVFENEFYRIKICNNGIEEIFDKIQNKPIASEGQYKVGEWILEHDEGSPWATLSPDMRRQPLSAVTKIVKYETGRDIQKVTFKISPDVLDAYAVSGFGIIYSIMLVKNNDTVFFSADVDWDTQNYRLRIAFPTELKGKHIYEIPYGMLERNPYEPDILLKNGASNWASAAGDYPAVRWAGIDEGNSGIAVFNQGTPSYQINTDETGKENIYLSVLRSPSVGTYLHCPSEYSMTDYDGMRDADKHHFEYALKAYDCGLYESGVVADGIGFNTGLIAFDDRTDLPRLPAVISENARISAIMPSQDKKGIIMRVVEYRGKNADLRIKIPDRIAEAYLTDLKEDIIEKVNIEKGVIGTSIKKFEILSFYLKTDL